jgi:hypothetical protein
VDPPLIYINLYITIQILYRFFSISPDKTSRYCGWIVESANGCIKQWRFPYKVVPDKLVKYIGDFVKIVCAILNCFRPQTLSIDTASNEIANVITPYIRMLDSDWLIAVMFFSKKSGLAL